MKLHPWQLETPLDAIVFDCDGTLSAIEGIDELAKHNGVADQVLSLTQEAMSKTGLTPAIYEKRLDLVYPNEDQVAALGDYYTVYQTPDVYGIIQILKRLNKTVYVVSAGLLPAVKIFGKRLDIGAQHIFAVDVQFDANGNFLDFDRTSFLTHNTGKRKIVEQLKMQHKNILHIGDGLNDYTTYDLVTRFVGYGGVYYRENIAAKCQYYIRSLSMAPLLPLAITQEETLTLTPNEKLLFEKGLEVIKQGLVSV